MIGWRLLAVAAFTLLTVLWIAPVTLLWTVPASVCWLLTGRLPADFLARAIFPPFMDRLISKAGML